MSDQDETLLMTLPPTLPAGSADCEGWCPPSSGAAPRRAGEYELSGVLAEGGLGVVYRARRAGAAPAAVKIPHQELSAHPVVLARFEREIEAIRRLQHPSVVRILDFGWLEDGRPYFAMELLSGESLHQHLEDRGRLSPHEALAILEPVCSALDAAHAQGIVHRDIKPSNVFLVDDDGQRRVVLLDFGVAKLLDAPGPALTTSRQLVGTVAYMSPEQLLGEPAEPRSDVYALGALLYTMLVGERPFDSGTSADMRRLMLHSAAPRPSLVAPLHAAFDEVVLRAMHRDPAVRHPSAAAFLAHATEACRAAALDPRAPVEPGGARRARAIGVYIELLTQPGALDEADAQLLDDVDSILPAACEHLEAAGLSLAVDTGNGALLVTERPLDPERDAAARRGVLDAACALHQRLGARDRPDPRVRVHLSVHTGEVVSNDAGDVVGGDLLDLSAWIPDDAAAGVFASAPAIAGLDLAAPPEASPVRLL